jgi:hypothetical protein
MSFAYQDDALVACTVPMAYACIQSGEPSARPLASHGGSRSAGRGRRAAVIDGLQRPWMSAGAQTASLVGGIASQAIEIWCAYAGSGVRLGPPSERYRRRASLGGRALVTQRTELLPVWKACWALTATPTQGAAALARMAAVFAAERRTPRSSIAFTSTAAMDSWPSTTSNSTTAGRRPG